MAKKNIDLVLLDVKLDKLAKPLLAVAPGYSGIRPGDVVVVQGHKTANKEAKGAYDVLRSMTVCTEGEVFPFILAALIVKEPDKLPRVIQKVQYTDFQFDDDKDGGDDGE